MKLRKDLTGMQVGRLTVLNVAERTASGTRWLCLCACGEKTIVYSFNLTSKSPTQSCGCLHREAVAAAATSHGDLRHGQRSPEHRIWDAMIQRCTNSNVKQYKDYGGRGITVTKRWRKFENFLADMGRRPRPELTLDRKNNDRGYSKANCRWATRKEQQANRRVST